LAQLLDFICYIRLNRIISNNELVINKKGCGENRYPFFILNSFFLFSFYFLCQQKGSKKFSPDAARAFSTRSLSGDNTPSEFTGSP